VAHHRAMKTRDKMSAVIEGLQRDHGLLAAYLEATDRTDWRTLHRNVEAYQASSTATQLPEVVPSTPSPFVFRRANLVQVP
jgi:hypothetical protein